MSIKYDSKHEILADIIREGSFNATFVVPALDRPYLWGPRQIMMLVDSLFRGWPFGALVLWEITPNCFEYKDGIPHRPFWLVVDRTGNDNGTQHVPLGPPTTYHLVLDGEQRLQSLILALGGDRCELKLLDSEWALDLENREIEPSNHWSKAALCIDLQKFLVELSAKNNFVRKIEAEKILEWAILDTNAGLSSEPRPPKHVYPLKTALENPGRFIRLSRLWDLVQKDLPVLEYQKLLEPMLKQHKVDDNVCSHLLVPLAEFMKVVENAKTNSYVHAIQIKSFESAPTWTKEDYFESIANILTRLNKAGRTLTREELTLAWLNFGLASPI